MINKDKLENKVEKTKFEIEYEKAKQREQELELEKIKLKNKQLEQDVKNLETGIESHKIVLPKKKIEISYKQDLDCDNVIKKLYKEIYKK